MKLSHNIFPLFFSILLMILGFIPCSFAQKKEEYKIAYQAQFYKNGQLDTPNASLNGEKHGNWIEYYSAGWKMVEKLKRSGFYRLIQYQEGQPIGTVYDFYRNGNLQWVGQFESLEPEVLIGVCVWYKRNGDILDYQNFDIINKYMKDDW